VFGARLPGPPHHAQGNAVVVGRKSPYSLYDPVIASFEDDQGLYNQADAGGFIKLQALRLRTLGVSRGTAK
jgi:argininosuccinate synthase